MSDSRPVYIQIIDRIYTMVLSGEYKPGSKLPTVRELAGLMQANPNTVQRALLSLEERGLIYTQRTTGKFITEDSGIIETVRKELFNEYLNEFLSKAGNIGIDKADVKKIINETEG